MIAEVDQNSREPVSILYLTAGAVRIFQIVRTNWKLVRNLPCWSA
jgi:hypothetical protein